MASHSAMSACTSLARSRMPHGTLTAWRTHAGTTRRAQRGTQRACGVSHAAAKACLPADEDSADRKAPRAVQGALALPGAASRLKEAGPVVRVYDVD